MKTPTPTKSPASGSTSRLVIALGRRPRISLRRPMDSRVKDMETTTATCYAPIENCDEVSVLLARG